MAIKLRRPRAPRPLPPPQTGDEVIEEADGAQMSLLEHLDELRRRTFRAVIALVIGTVAGFPLATPVLEFLLQPYGRPLQVLDPTGNVVAYFRVALFIGAILAIPVITYQAIMFVLPALTPKEKVYIRLALPAITLLFLIGISFAWFMLIPPALQFLETFQPTLFNAEWTADGYFGFITALVFWMGVAFEMPLVFFVVALLGLVSPQALIRQWRIAVVGAAVAAAAITPTIDPVNMALVMGPLLALYALSVVLVFVGRRFSRFDQGARA